MFGKMTSLRLRKDIICSIRQPINISSTQLKVHTKIGHLNLLYIRSHISLSLLINNNSNKLSSSETFKHLPDQFRQNQHQQHMQQKRFMMSKKGAKMGHHIQNLADMAHQKEHEAAVERREKKKEKTAARKGGNVIRQDDSEFDNYEAKQKNKIQSDHNDEWDKVEDEDDEHDTTVLPNPNDVKEKMMKYVDQFRDYLKSIRGGGSPTVEMFDDVMVRDAYGHGTGDVSVKAVAQIVMTSPTLATATCFDPTTTKAVVVAIRDKLELNPIPEEGTGIIKIPIPRISMEVRQQLVSTVHKRAENFRVRIRNYRRTVLEIVKQGVAGKLDGVSKDDAFRVQQEIEVMTDHVIKELNKLSEKKEGEIMLV